MSQYPCCRVVWSSTTFVPLPRNLFLRRQSHLPLHFRPHISQDITKAEVKRRLDVFLKEVRAATRHKDFSPGTSWWVWKRNSKTTHPNAALFEKQLGLTEDQLKRALGRYWRKALLAQIGEKLMLWSGGMDGMEWITVTPSTGEPVLELHAKRMSCGPARVRCEEGYDQASGGRPSSTPWRHKERP